MKGIDALLLRRSRRSASERPKELGLRVSGSSQETSLAMSENTLAILNEMEDRHVKKQFKEKKHN